MGSMRPLRILFTNNTLAGRGGTELYTRDVSWGLARRGHQVAAYASQVGEVADEMQASGHVTVMDTLDAAPWIPDVIHAQHHLEAMTALLRFPDVPAIYVRHGYRPWQETPPLHPRIMRYFAVEEECLRQTIEVQGIPRDRAELLLNFVDTERFRQRNVLPAAPHRAVVFSNYAREEVHLAPLREVCSRLGIALDAIGAGAGNPVQCPEAVLGDYDLVFAAGRSALEAMAVGCAVVLLCEPPGCGPMVSMENLARLRRLNFGSKSMTDPLVPERVERHVARYNATDARQVSDFIRRDASLETYLGRLEDIYSAALESFRHSEISPEDEARAEAAYLREQSLRIKDREDEAATLRIAYEAANLALEQTKSESVRLEREWRRRHDEESRSLMFRARRWLLSVPGLGAFLHRMAAAIKSKGPA